MPNACHGLCVSRRDSLADALKQSLLPPPQPTSDDSMNLLLSALGMPPQVQQATTAEGPQVVADKNSHSENDVRAADADDDDDEEPEVVVKTPKIKTPVEIAFQECMVLAKKLTHLAQSGKDICKQVKQVESVWSWATNDVPRIVMRLMGPEGKTSDLT